MRNYKPAAQLYILLVISAGVVLAGFELPRINPADGLILTALCGLASAAQVFKVQGATKQSMFHISWAVFGFTYVLLGAPAALAAIIVAHTVEWAWHRYPWFVQLFNLGTFAVVVCAANWLQATTISLAGDEPWAATIGLLLAAAAFTLFNHMLIAGVISLTQAGTLEKSGVLSSFTMLMDLATFGLGAAAALIWTINPAAVALIIAPLYLIYSTLKVPALKRQTQLDPKTGLYNARYFQEALEREIARSDRSNHPMTVVVADLDLLRNINNTYGHLAGDQVLVGVANILKAMVREYDVVARFGGEEYTILMPEMAPEDALERVEAIRQAIEAARFEVATSTTPIQVTMSFGVAGRLHPRQTSQEIMHAADVAVYQAKLSGRNRIVLADAARAANMPLVSDLPSLDVTIKVEAQQTTPPPVATTAPVYRPSRWTPWYIGLLVVLATAALVLTWPTKFATDWLGLAVFAALTIALEFAAIELYSRGTTVSIGAVVMISGAALFGVPAVVVLSIVTLLPALFRRRAPLYRAIFNLSNYILCSSVVVAGLSIFNDFHSQPAYVQLPVMVVVSMLVYAVNTTTVSLVMGFSTGQPIRKVWSENFSWLWSYYIGFGVVAYALVYGYSNTGLLGVFVMLVPLVLLRWSQAQYISRTALLVSELRKTNAELVTTSGQLAMLNEGLIRALSQAIDLRDPFVEGHSQQVARYAVMTAREMGLDESRIERVRRAALLHDLGKIGIPDAILLKSGRLTRQEYELIKRHAPLGAELIEKLQPLSELAPFIRHHHERFDGRGYPEGLCGDQIPLEARILSLADTIEAMASDRPYRPAQPAARIMAEVKSQAGAQFDPIVIAAFERVLEREGMSIITNSAFSLSRLAPQFTQGIEEDHEVVYVPHPTGHLDGIPRSFVHD